MKGLEASRKIHQLPPERCPHILAMTANAMGDCEECLAAGMNDYIAKPIRGEQLLNALNGLSPAIGTNPVPTSEEPAVDLKTVEDLRTSMGDDAVVRELAGLFLEDAPRQITLLEDADAAVARRGAHTLKSSARVIGALHLSELAARAESAASEGSRSLVRDLGNEIEIEFARVSRELKKIVGIPRD